VFADPDKPAQSAQTWLQRLQTVDLPHAVSPRHPSSRYSLVRLLPYTGRKHQLRRHLAHISHPIVGDTTHGDGRHNRFFREQFDCQRLMLCNTSLTIRHPIHGFPLRLQVALDDPWLQLFQQFGW
jgi:tRNA pseudouridine65 synthase